MTVRRVVVGDSFFDRMDELLLPERGAEGEASVGDFLVFEVPGIVERFAVDWDRLLVADAEIEGVRVLVQRGTLVHAYAAYGLLLTDGTIELIGLAVDP